VNRADGRLEVSHGNLIWHSNRFYISAQLQLLQSYRAAQPASPCTSHMASWNCLPAAAAETTAVAV